MKQKPNSLRTAIEKYLEEEPRARERKNKDRAIVNTLIQDIKFFPIIRALKEDRIDIKMLVMFVQDYNSTDRAWRKVLEERKELRGSDYSDKEQLELEKQRELGYPV